MPATQPIPQNTPDSATREAGRILAVHNQATDSRTRTPARWNPPTQRSAAAGENAGRRVK